MVTSNGVQDAPTPNNDLVPKADFDRVRVQADEATKGLESLKAQLLDPNYLEYLEHKNAGGQKPAAPTRPANLNSMSIDDLQKLIADSSMNAVRAALNPVYTRLNEVQAKLELEDVRTKYADFDKHSDAVTGILQTSPNELTIEQAYIIAKANAPAEAPKEAPKTPAKAPVASEKPGTTVPLSNDTVTSFKNPAQAGMAAWSEVAAKHGISGDTI